MYFLIVYNRSTLDALLCMLISSVFIIFNAHLILYIMMLYLFIYYLIVLLFIKYYLFWQIL